MDLAVGNIVTGKVTTITKFGAFIALPEGKSGLVHISEVAPTFVSDVHDFLAEGQEVTVKILAITPEGKINLSIKQAMPRPQRPGRREAPARRRYPDCLLGLCHPGRCRGHRWRGKNPGDGLLPGRRHYLPE